MNESAASPLAANIKPRRRLTDHVHMSDEVCRAMAVRFAKFFDEQKLLEPIVARVRRSSQ